MWQGSAEAQVRGRAEAELRWAGQDPRGFVGGHPVRPYRIQFLSFPPRIPRGGICCLSLGSALTGIGETVSITPQPRKGPAGALAAGSNAHVSLGRWHRECGFVFDPRW